ncbi:DNA-primase RepB domain-containing protein [Pseudorhodobacter sp. W20_MBD10_FR17]|uniref:DNA-primase RepB domain-containing protein n=1 Tax=Pseudorhodobacter sp. W20_MBD10_FR17 TaxID=3240266 RepID=UPI003F9C1205
MNISNTNALSGQVVSLGNPSVIVVNRTINQATNPHPFDTKTWAGQAEYVSALFGKWVAKGLVWTAGMPTVEGENREWFGAAGLGHLERAFPKMEADLYMAIGVMDPNAKARGNRNVVAQPLLIVDDIGTKIDPAKWDAQFKAGFPLPTAKIETSPGNQTWIWALEGDAADPARWVDLACVRAWLVELGLTDDVMDPARYIRLPGGWNSKKKYRDKNGGQPVEVGLVEWNECRSGAGFGGARVDLEKVGSVLLGSAGADWGLREFPQTASGRSQASSAALGGMMGAGALVRSADLGKPDPLMKMGQVLGMNLVQIRPGVVEALCPNHAAHGDRADTGFAFLGDGLMHCNHASCQELSTRDFRSMMEEEFDRRAAVAVGLGLGGLEGCATASQFLAREAFAGAGVGGQGASVEDVIEPMAARAEARVESEGADGGNSKAKRAAHVAAADLVEGQKMIPFLDPKGGLWLWVSGRLCNLKTMAGFLRLAGWLSQQGLDVTGAARNNLVETLEGRAASRPTQDVFCRVANGGTAASPKIFVNLMDAENRAVQIDGNGWQIVQVSDLPLPLAHRTGGLPLPEPVAAIDGVSFLDRLGRHIPIAPVIRKNDPKDMGVQQRAALVTFSFAQFVRTGAVPHLLFAGEQAGGKTTAAKRLNGLTDPDAGAVVSRLPSDGAAIISMVGQQSNFVLDNTSGVRSEHADVICSLASGGSQVARKLYTDGDRSISSALCSIIFTSVLDGGITKRPDLQDRLLTVVTQPLAKNQRKAETQLDAAWAADLPHLLADLFDLLVVGLKNASIVAAAQACGALSPPPRFADTAQVAEAAAWHGVGWPAGLLTNALNAMRAEAAEGQLSDDPIGYRLRAFLRKQPGGVWVGGYDDLDRALACEDGPVWDRNKIPLKNGLSRIKGPLRDLWGVAQTDAGRTKHARKYEFRIVPDAAGGE